MPLSSMPINRIEVKDLERLVDDGVIENRRLDYKQEVPGRSDQDKRDFLKDVAAMANTLGGDILYGIEEERDNQGKPTGVPKSLPGVKIENWDAVRLDLESRIRDGIQPHVQGIDLAKTDLPSGTAVVVLRIPASLQAPHIISFKQASPFYLRTTAGNSPMDIGEIRQAFLRTASALQRADSFRRQRVNEVLAGHCPTPMPDGAKTFFHVIPLATQEFAIDLTNESVVDKVKKVDVLPEWASTTRLNFDGHLTFCRSKEGRVSPSSYVQVFRNAAIEFCDSYLLNDPHRPGSRIISLLFEEQIVVALKQSLTLYESLGIPPPVAFFLTMTGVKDYHFSNAPTDHLIDRDTLLLSCQLVQSLEQEQVEKILKPLFDTVANAAGLPGSSLYDESGNWRGTKVTIHPF